MAVSRLSLLRVRAGAHTLQGELSLGAELKCQPHANQSPSSRGAKTHSDSDRGWSLHLSWQLALGISRLIVKEERPPPFTVTWAPRPRSGHTLRPVGLSRQPPFPVFPRLGAGGQPSPHCHHTVNAEHLQPQAALGAQK